VSFAALAAEVSVFDILLGVIPCSPTCCHRYGEEQTYNDAADKHTTEGLLAECKRYNQRYHNRQQGWDDHFFLRRSGHDIHAFAIFGLDTGKTFSEALDFPELPAYFFHD